MLKKIALLLASLFLWGIASAASAATNGEALACMQASMQKMSLDETGARRLQVGQDVWINGAWRKLEPRGATIWGLCKEGPAVQTSSAASVQRSAAPLASVTPTPAPSVVTPHVQAPVISEASPAPEAIVPPPPPPLEAAESDTTTAPPPKATFGTEWTPLTPFIKSVESAYYWFLHDWMWAKILGGIVLVVIAGLFAHAWFTREKPDRVFTRTPVNPEAEVIVRRDTRPDRAPQYEQSWDHYGPSEDDSPDDRGEGPLPARLAH